MVPLAPPGTVDRPRIDRLLDHSDPYRVVLVCAPAGFGKSVLVSNWARRRTARFPVGWVNCSRLLDSPTAFWSGCIRALAQATSTTTPTPRTGLSAPASDHREHLNDLLAWMAQLPEGTALVFDDLQAITSPALFADLHYVISRLPGHITVVLVTRADPPIALHRIRLDGRLLDLRARDLAFTEIETGRLLLANGLHVDRADLQLLQERSEGWAAGLRLAMISMAHSEATSDVVRRLAGTTEAVSAYLAAQVLAQLAPADRDLLLDTCVVDDFTAPLAEALTGRVGVMVDVERVAEQIGFLTRSTRDQPTYRYYPMFAELLRSQLAYRDPLRFAEQHRRAASWFQRQQDTGLTIRHSLRARDWNLAAQALAAGTVSFVVRGQFVELRTLLRGFPRDLAATDPRLLLVRAVTLVFENESEQAADLLDQARAGLTGATDDDGRRIQGVLSYGTALAAYYRGDTGAVLEVLDPEGPPVPGPDDTGFRFTDLDLHAAWSSTRAAALMWSGRPAAALAEAKHAQEDVRAGAAGWPMVTVLGVRALIYALDGRLAAAQAAVDELTEFVRLHEGADAPDIALTDFATSWVAMERAEFSAAEDALARAYRIWIRVRAGADGAAGEVLRARLVLTAGAGPTAAAYVLDHAFDSSPRPWSPLLERLARRIRVEISVAQGDLVEAARMSDGDRPGEHVREGLRRLRSPWLGPRRPDPRSGNRTANSAGASGQP